MKKSHLRCCQDWLARLIFRVCCVLIRIGFSIERYIVASQKWTVTLKHFADQNKTSDDFVLGCEYICEQLEYSLQVCPDEIHWEEKPAKCTCWGIGQQMTRGSAWVEFYRLLRNTQCPMMPVTDLKMLRHTLRSVPAADIWVWSLRADTHLSSKQHFRVWGKSHTNGATSSGYRLPCLAKIWFSARNGHASDNFSLAASKKICGFGDARMHVSAYGNLPKCGVLLRLLQHDGVNVQKDGRVTIGMMRGSNKYSCSSMDVSAIE